VTGDRPQDRSEPPARGYATLPPGRLPEIGILELVGALQQRHERRVHSLADLRATLAQLEARIEAHAARVARVHAALAARRASLRSDGA
jgi:hypothetical protein